jgi:hypothetical protein
MTFKEGLERSNIFEKLSLRHLLHSPLLRVHTRWRVWNLGSTALC